MNGWLAAAEKLLGRRPSQPPTPYEVTCTCGGVVTGERTAAVQTSLCPDCRNSLLILPATVYPAAKAPRRKVVVVPKPQAEPAAPNGDEETGPPPDEVRQEARNPATVAHRDRPAKPVSAPRRPVRQIVGESISALNVDRLRRKVFTPVRLVLGGVASVVALTGWWIVHLKALDRAEQVVVSASKLGEQALQEHDLGEAGRQYRLVRSALDLLGRNDSHARTLRQTARETGAAADLASSSLTEILHEAVSATSGRTTYLTWEETFHSRYKGEWVVLDANVSRSAGTAGTPRFDIDFPLSDGTNRGMIVADLDAFEKAILPGGAPQRVIFAAQLDDFRPDPLHGNTWRIVFRPATGFLWSNVAHLELLGMTVDEATKQVLADQTSRVKGAQ